jgi:hypothetical protein
MFYLCLIHCLTLSRTMFLPLSILNSTYTISYLSFTSIPINMVASRNELDSLAKIDSSAEFRDTKHIFKDVGWMPFLEKFDGYDTEISLQFPKTFDGHRTIIKGLELVITKILISRRLISQPFCLPCIGERRCKGKLVAKDIFNQLLIPKFKYSYWSRGIPKNWLLGLWGKVLYILQKFVTCEVRFDTLYIYISC